MRPGSTAITVNFWFGGLTSLMTWAMLALAGCGGSGGGTDLTGVANESLSGMEHLTVAEVQKVIAQAAIQATASGLPVTIAVVDHEGVVLGVLRMGGATVARADIRLTGGGAGGLDGITLAASLTPIVNATAASDAAISKAGTAAFFSTQRNAFTTRTAGFIVQEHFPPQVNPSPGGPLFGVQFSNLRCSNVVRTGVTAGTNDKNLPLGLSADPGGLPLYKNGVAVGGIGVEGDGIYTLDPGQPDTAPTLEEIIAAAGTLGFSAPASIRGDQIFVDGIRLLFANAELPPSAELPLSQATATYNGFIPPLGGGTQIVVPRPSPATTFDPAPPAFNGLSVTVDRNIPVVAGGILTAAEVTQILRQAAIQANVTRAAIRLPIGSPARVSITVVDTNGAILGIIRTLDAPLFGFDVSAQKARTAAFFSNSSAAGDLTAAGLGSYVAAAAADGLALDGSVAFSVRAVGFLSQPIFPPGAIAPFSNGPFSKPLGQWSIFNTGLQLDLIQPQLGNPGTGCNPGAITQLGNGITIFPGGFPLYKNGVLVGAIGISGDGVDQDDLIGFAGSAGFEAPADMRSDTVMVRGAALPYVVIPRHPNL